MPTATSAGGANTAPAGMSDEEDKKWTWVKNVPIFDEHDGDQEESDIDWTPEVLEKIVEQNNLRIKSTNDEIPVTRGHTGEGIDPPILGWASNFRMDAFNDKKAIYCDMKFTHENYKEVEKMGAGKPLGRRSVEIWQDFIIDPIALLDRPILDSIALLSGDRPARDLGLGDNNIKNKSKKYIYSMGDTKMNPKKSYDLNEEKSSPMEDPGNPGANQEKKFEQPEMIDEANLVNDTPNANEPSEAEITDLISNLLTGINTLNMAYCKKYNNGAMNEEPAMNAKEDENDDDGDDDVEPAKLRMKHQQLKRKFHKLSNELNSMQKNKDDEVKSLFAKVAELERKEIRAQRTADLLQLEAEGFAFDMSSELEDVVTLTPALYKKHINSIKKNYRKAPINVNVIPQAVPAEGGAPSPDRFEVMRQATLKAQEKYNKEKI